jgi:hypothetical protein
MNDNVLKRTMSACNMTFFQLLMLSQLYGKVMWLISRLHFKSMYNPFRQCLLLTNKYMIGYIHYVINIYTYGRSHKI